jgi:fumarate reductase flavoprotein subunit
MAMAYRAGIPLKDMEFIQYHPTGLPGTGILMTEGCRGEGGILVNKDGYRYLQDYGLGPPDPWPRLKAMELGPRDRLSQAFWHEQKKGRTDQTKQWGDVVYLDLRALGEKKINERLPFVRELAKSYVGRDFVTDLVPVRPVVHYMMGGIHTDIDAATPIGGVFAAGECACISINGANRLGSNSLTELLVFGSRAGKGAANYAKAGHSLVEESKIKDLAHAVESRTKALLYRSGRKETVSGLRVELLHAMEKGAGIYRTEESLKETVDKIAELLVRYRSVTVDDHSSVFNTAFIGALELGSMLDIAQAVAIGALNRKESRGSHQRLDYEMRDDRNFLKHTLIYYSPSGDPRIDYLNVVITRSQPAERLYGGAAEKAEQASSS